jgi:hypothetical protein
MKNKTISALLIPVLVSGCAQLEFRPEPTNDALTYYEPQPYLLVETDKDCATKSSVIVLPGKARSVKLRSGYGSSTLSVTLSNGMITNVNQEVDTKIPETITAVGGLAKNLADAGLFANAPASGCIGQSTLFPIVDGRIQRAGAFSTSGRLRGAL